MVGLLGSEVIEEVCDMNSRKLSVLTVHVWLILYLCKDVKQLLSSTATEWRQMYDFHCLG
jgi:hypothetical protein